MLDAGNSGVAGLSTSYGGAQLALDDGRYTTGNAVKLAQTLLTRSSFSPLKMLAFISSTLAGSSHHLELPSLYENTGLCS